MRRRAIGEIMAYAIILGATAVVATIMLNAISEQSQVARDDLRSRLDILRAQAVEQLDVISTEWRGTDLTFLVSNFGDYPTTYPFELYRLDGTNATNANVEYLVLGAPRPHQPHCTPSMPCNLYNTTLAPKSSIQLRIPWALADGNTLIIITDTGRALRVSVN